MDQFNGGGSLRDSVDLSVRALALSGQLRSGNATLLGSLLHSEAICDGCLALDLNASSLADRLAITPHHLAPEVTTLVIPFHLRRRGVELKLVAGARAPVPDPALRRALADAHRWAAALKAGTPLHDIARTANHHEALVRIRTPLAFLSPRIQRSILDGTQPAKLTLERLVRKTLPLAWDAQEQLCGF